MSSLPKFELGVGEFLLGHSFRVRSDKSRFCLTIKDTKWQREQLEAQTDSSDVLKDLIAITDIGMEVAKAVRGVHNSYQSSLARTFAEKVQEKLKRHNPVELTKRPPIFAPANSETFTVMTSPYANVHQVRPYLSILPVGDKFFYETLAKVSYGGGSLVEIDFKTLGL